MKKILSSLLACMMIFSNAITLMAAETTTIKAGNSIITILENSSDKYVVKETKDDVITTATNDLSTGILTISKTDLNGQKISADQKLDLNQIAARANSRENENNTSPSTRASHVYQHTFSNVEYDVWYKNPVEWKLRFKDDYFTTNEDYADVNDLEEYREIVEDVNTKEGLIIAEASIGVLTTIISALASGGLAAGLAAAAGTGAVAATVIALNDSINDAEYLYWRIRNA